MHLGIDVGTSSTAAVLTGADGAVLPLLFDGSPLLPSAVHLDVARGVLAVGGEAVRGGALDPDRCEPHPKLRVAAETVTLGGTAVPVVYLFAAVLWAVHAEALRVTGGIAPLEVALTHPGSWDAHHRGALLTAASMAGLPAVRLVPSPVAVAYRLPAAAGQCVVMYELGAGTFEVTVLRPAGDGHGPQVVAAGTLPGAAGLDIDAAIAAHLLAVTLGGPAGTRQRRALLEQARFAKELLSSGAAAVVPVAGRGEVTLTPDDLDRIATPLLRPTAELTLHLMRTAGVAPGPVAGSVAGVYLAGGGARMPLVGTLLHRVTGVRPVVLERPELAAAEGSVAVLTAAPPSAAPPPAAPPPRRARETATRETATREKTGTGGDGGPLWAWLPASAGLIPGRAWRDAPFHPLQLGLPSGNGWTIRARFVEPDQTVFLSRGGGPLLFHTVDGLAAYLQRDAEHELAGLDGWDQVRDRFVALVRDPADEDQIDLDLVQYNLGFPPQQWMPDLLIAARDVAVELAEAFDLRDVGELLAEGGLLDEVDELLRDAERTLAGRSARRRLDALDADEVRWAWHAIVTRLDGIAAWAD